jgi:hypothetical protein
MLPNIMGDNQVRFEMSGIEDRPSSNFGPRRDGAVPDMVVLHYTGMDTAEGSNGWPIRQARSARITSWISMAGWFVWSPRKCGRGMPGLPGGAVWRM